MNQESISKYIRNTYLWVSLLVLILLIVIYPVLDSLTEGKEHQGAIKSLIKLSANVIPSIIPVILLYILSHFFYDSLLKRINDDIEREKLITTVLESTGNRAVYERFTFVDWHSLFKESKNVTIVVHYFDSWITQNSENFGNFLNRGGNLSFIVPEPKESIVTQFKDRFPDYETSEIINKIKAIKPKIQRICDENEIKKPYFEIKNTRKLILYSAILFDETLVLSPFEHVRRVGIGSPAVVINLRRFPKIKKWILNEIRYLTDNA